MSTVSKTYIARPQRDPDTNAITIAPNIADIDLADTYTQLVDTKNTSLANVFSSSTVPASELNAAMAYRNAFKQGDTITAVNKFFNSLPTSYIQQPDFSLDAVLYWYQKSKYSNKEITAYKSQNDFNAQHGYNLQTASLFVQNSINSLINTNNYFDIVSDSIGIIVNSKFLQLDSTLPLFDVTQQYYGTPIPIAASTDSKISATTRNVMFNLSQKTTTYMKRNLLNIGYSNTALQQNLAADATTSHGLNLINDLPTFVNINKKLNDLKLALTAVFPQLKAFSFVQYLNTIGNVTALNLRDIFPVAAGDRDFKVVTSQKNAQASIDEANQEKADAQASAAIAQQQQGVTAANSNGPGVYSPGAVVTPTSNINIAPSGSQPGYNIATINGQQYISKQDLYNLNLANVQNSGLVGYVPTDGASYGVTPQEPGESDQAFQQRNQQEWATFFTNYASQESATTGDGGNWAKSNSGYIKVTDSGDGGRSLGVYSMSVGENGLTSDSIFNPAANSAAAVQRSAALIKGAGVIGGGANGARGMGAYFGPIQRGEAFTG